MAGARSLFSRIRQKLSIVSRLERLYRYAISGDVPQRDRLLFFFTLVYFISPFDIIPDALPFIGFLDDLTVVGAALAYLEWRARQWEKKNLV